MISDHLVRWGRSKLIRPAVLWLALHATVRLSGGKLGHKEARPGLDSNPCTGRQLSAQSQTKYEAGL